jgi:hypothetical protein
MQFNKLMELTQHDFDRPDSKILIWILKESVYSVSQGLHGGAVVHCIGAAKPFFVQEKPWEVWRKAGVYCGEK